MIESLTVDLQSIGKQTGQFIRKDEYLSRLSTMKADLDYSVKDKATLKQVKLLDYEINDKLKDTDARL